MLAGNVGVRPAQLSFWQKTNGLQLIALDRTWSN